MRSAGNEPGAGALWALHGCSDAPRIRPKGRRAAWHYGTNPLCAALDDGSGRDIGLYIQVKELNLVYFYAEIEVARHTPAGVPVTYRLREGGGQGSRDTLEGPRPQQLPRQAVYMEEAVLERPSNEKPFRRRPLHRTDHPHEEERNCTGDQFRSAICRHRRRTPQERLAQAALRGGQGARVECPAEEERGNAQRQQDAVALWGRAALTTFTSLSSSRQTR